jgi:hypothetical protein
VAAVADVAAAIPPATDPITGSPAAETSNCLRVTPITAFLPDTNRRAAASGDLTGTDG